MPQRLKPKGFGFKSRVFVPLYSNSILNSRICENTDSSQDRQLSGHGVLWNE